jgi:hypothetical protein
LHLINSCKGDDLLNDENLVEALQKSKDDSYQIEENIKKLN